MNRSQEMFQTWNKVASVYQDKFMDLKIYNFSYDVICETIKKEKAQLLELGCGPGNITRYLLSKRPDFEFFGIDIAPNMIELAKRNNATAGFAVMDLRKINVLDTNYDGIVCGFCLPYLSQTESEKLISDCSKLLNEDGLLYLSFVEGNPSKSDYQVSSSGDRMFFYFHDLAEITEQLIKYDFQIEHNLNVAFEKSGTEKELHTILLARKKGSSHPPV